MTDRAQRDRATAEDLRAEIVRLGQWYLDVQVTPELSTRVSREAPPGTYPDAGWAKTRFHSPRGSFLETMSRVYPKGLEGRTVLDCACNCGGYLFWCKELGAGECLGFDARDHWIDQARFLMEHRDGPTDRMRFEVWNLYEVPGQGLQPFDVVLFNGIFYHLPDPLAGLKIAADLASELLVVETGTASGLPDGMLVVGGENPERLQSGVHGVNWRPTGPKALKRYLSWLGFADVRLVWWGKEVDPGWGRMLMLASRKPGLLDNFTELVPPPAHLTSEG